MRELRAGLLLVATPILDDPNFRRTVVLLCTHDEGGSFGLVLNRPLEAAVLDLVPDWRRFVAAPQVVFAGGPVDAIHGFALGHSARPLDESWWVPVTAEVGLLAVQDDAAPLEVIEQVRIFFGYAGWGAGQLEEEVAEEAWFVVDAVPGDVFTAEPALLWQQVLARQPGELRLFARFPADPRLN